MSVELSDEQVLLRDSVQRYARDYTFESRRELMASAAGFGGQHWRAFADMGWLAAPFSEGDGGLGGGAVEACLVMEGMGQALMLEPYLASVVLCGTLLADVGTKGQKETYLEPLMAGHRQMALAFAEPQSGYDLSDCATRVTEQSDGFRLSGRKSVVFHGGEADTLIVAGRTRGMRAEQDGISLFLVPRDAAGVSMTAYPTMDGLRAADVVLEETYVDRGNLLGELHGGWAPLDLAIDHGISAVVAEAVGAMNAVFDLTAEYLKTRKQFGRPLSTNQALQHRMVDMHIAIEEARAMMLYGAYSLSLSDGSARRKALSAAKIHVGKAARLVGQEAVQLHGAIGVTDEASVSHYFKRLTMIDIAFGNVAWHERRFAAH